jgi:hypothetical protein
LQVQVTVRVVEFVEHEPSRSAVLGLDAQYGVVWFWHSGLQP